MNNGSLPTECTPGQLFGISCEACDCDDPNCGLVLSPRCHPRAGTWVKFFKSTSALQVECAKCGELVVRIKIGAVA